MAPRTRALLLLLLTGACAAEREAPAVAALGAALDSGRASLSLPRPEAAPATPPAPPAQPARLSLVATPRQGAGELAALLGTAPDALRRQLGPPALLRREGSAEIWLYAGQDCFVDLILYPLRDGLRVAHASARAEGTTRVTEAACLNSLGQPAAVTAGA